MGINDFAVAVNKDDRLEVLVTLALIHVPMGISRLRQTASGEWTKAEESPSPLVAIGFDMAKMARNADGRLEAVLIDDSNKVVLTSSQVRPGGDWSEWYSLESPDDQIELRGMALGQNKDGRLEVFVVATDHSLWHSGQPSPGGRPWTRWSSLESPPGPVEIENGSILVGQNKDERLEVFCTDRDDLWHIWQRSQGGWSGWSSLGHPPASGSSVILDPAAVVRTADGRLEVFCMEGPNLWHIWQRSEGGWSDWSSLGDAKGIGDAHLDVRLNAAGRLVLVGSNTLKLFMREQVAPNGDWSPWVSLGNPTITHGGLFGDFVRPTFVAKADGQLELLMNTGNRLIHFREPRWTSPQFVTV